jgi:nucleotide-binding universal stress UspA family protein
MINQAIREFVMFKHILIATDGSELAERAASQGFELARLLKAKVTAVTVTEPWAAVVTGEAALGFPLEEYEKGAAQHAAQILSRITDMAKKTGVACATTHVKDQFAAEGIIAAAKDQGCDLIVMASHGRRGLAKLFLGSEASKVLTLSSVPVLICR